MYNNFMSRVLIKVEYDGRNFFGWQKQPNKRTVQEELEKAIEKLTGERVEVFASGRTDRGVHALDQGVHFDLEKEIPVSRLVTAINNLLPNDVSVKKAKKVANDFHARFDIKSKTYIYQIYNAKTKSALFANRSAFVNYDLDIDKMKSVADLLQGKHNFKGFCSADATVKDFEREIYSINVTRKGKFIKIEVTGNGFLYNMVRIIAGTIVDAGRGLLTEESVKKALENGDRSFAGRTMPPEGLFLTKTNY